MWGMRRRVTRRMRILMMRLCKPRVRREIDWGRLRLKVYRGLGIDLVEDGSGGYAKAVVRMLCS
jgi:hypothetical protein